MNTTTNLTTQTIFNCFLLQKNVLYNILKVLRNPMTGKYLNIKINNTESEQIGIILGNHLLYDKSMKFGT